ncbi:MAG: hypothetical protein B2I17_03965 [Thermoplasmatales archaeon B_DKE]|nr:MAG: hypothetical protein B2I17_03965 [Thermoplasmatales archaeon B_DKE]
MKSTLKKGVTIKKRPEAVWKALTDPAMTKRWIMGLEVSSEWVAGGPITRKGFKDGNEIIHKGTIRSAEVLKTLQFTDFGMELGLYDTPENYTRITYNLSFNGSGTMLSVVEDHFNGNEKRYKDAEAFWEAVLSELKRTVES